MYFFFFCNFSGYNFYFLFEEQQRFTVAGDTSHAYVTCGVPEFDSQHYIQGHLCLYRGFRTSFGGLGPALARLMLEKKNVKEAWESEVCFWFLFVFVGGCNGFSLALNKSFGWSGVEGQIQWCFGYLIFVGLLCVFLRYRKSLGSCEYHWAQELLFKREMWG